MRTMTVTGTGRVSLKPDLTVVNCTVKSVNRIYEKAVETSNGKLDALREALSPAGFTKDDLKTVSYDVRPEYEGRQDKNGSYRNVFMGYACIHRLKLEFDLDPVRLGQVISAVSSTVAEPELSVAFSVKDTDAVCGMLLRDAAADAKKNAKILARASGVRLGDIQTVNYSKEEIRFFSPTSCGMNDMVMGKMCCESSVDMVPDDVKASDTATFVWEIL